MTPVSPISFGNTDLSSMMIGSDTAGSDVDANERFATALETAAGRAPATERRDDASAKPASERSEAPARRQEEKDSSSSRSKDDEESASGKHSGGSGKSSQQGKEKDDSDAAVTGDAGDATVAPPPPVVKKPATITSGGISALTAGASAGSAFVTELQAAVISTKAGKASAVVPLGPATAMQNLAAKAVDPKLAGTAPQSAEASIKTAKPALGQAVAEVPARRATDVKTGTDDKLTAEKLTNQNAKAAKAIGLTSGDKVATEQALTNPTGATVLSPTATSSSATSARSDKTILDKVAKLDTKLDVKTDLKTELKAEPAPVVLNNVVTNPFALTSPNELTAVKPSGMPLPMEPFKQVVHLITPLINRGNGDYSVTVQLHPAELGSVQVQVQLTNGQISMQLSADNQQARQSLQDSMKELRESLESSGLSTGSLDVSTKDHSDQGGGAKNGHQSPNNSPSVTDKEQTNFLSRLNSVGLGSVSTSSAGDGPLDVRV